MEYMMTLKMELEQLDKMIEKLEEKREVVLSKMDT